MPHEPKQHVIDSFNVDRWGGLTAHASYWHIEFSLIKSNYGAGSLILTLSVTFV